MARARAKVAALLVMALLLPVQPAWAGERVATAPLATKVSAAEQETILALHNQYRAAAGVAALVWDDQLASDAQTWVDALVARGGTLAHSNPADPNDPDTGHAKGEGRTSRVASRLPPPPPSGTRRSPSSTPPRTSPGSTTEPGLGQLGPLHADDVERHDQDRMWHRPGAAVPDHLVPLQPAGQLRRAAAVPERGDAPGRGRLLGTGGAGEPRRGARHRRRRTADAAENPAPTAETGAPAGQPSTTATDVSPTTEAPPSG